MHDIMESICKLDFCAQKSGWPLLLPCHSSVIFIVSITIIIIIIISALSTSQTYMYLGHGSLVPQHAIPPRLLLVEQGQ